MVWMPRDFPELMAGIIGVLVVVTVLGIAGFAVLSNPTEASDWRGALIVAFASAVSYWMGTSSGSKRKSDAINDALVAKVSAAPTIPLEAKVILAVAPSAAVEPEGIHK